MINKLTLQNIISKYYLNGLIESVKWSIKNETLSIRFMLPTRDMIGELEFNGLKLANTELAIFNTSQLNKLIGITQGDLLLDIIKQGNIANKLIVQDNQFILTYALADTLLINKVGVVEEPLQANTTAILNNEQITALIKAKSALPDTNHIVLTNDTDFNGDPIINFVLGDDSEFSNKITYSIKSTVDSALDLPFDANTFKEILSANKDAKSGELYIFDGGLMKLHFEYDNVLKTTYYLIRKQE